MKRTIEIKGKKVNLYYCLNLKNKLEEIIGYIKDFDIINESNYVESINKLKKDLNNFMDVNFKVEK